MITTYKENASASIGTTEYSLANDSTTLTPQTTAGVFQPFIDFNALAAGDAFQITIYEKVVSTGTQHIVHHAEVYNAQSGDSPAWAGPALALLNGWDITVKKLAGTDRTIPFSIRKAS